MNTSLACKLVLCIAIVLALVSSYGLTGLAKSSITKLIKSEKTVKELTVDMKLFLTKMKLRRVPLAKRRSEKLLAKLYREERSVNEQIANLKRNLHNVHDRTRNHFARVIEVERVSPRDKSDEDRPINMQNLMKVSELTQGRIDSWRGELKQKEHEHAEIRAKIDEAKKIIKNPESYISVPSKYNHLDPEEEQERERENLLRDRINIQYRAQMEAGQVETPLWISDDW